MGFSLNPAQWPLAGAAGAMWAQERLWFLLGAVGTGFAAYRRGPADRVLLWVLVPAFLFIGSWPKGGSHYLIHLYPLLGLLGARMVLEVARPRYGWWAALFLVLVSLPNAWAGLSQGRNLARQDMRLVVAGWIEANIPSGATIAGYWIPYCPPVRTTIEKEKLRKLVLLNAHDPEAVSRLAAIGRRIPFYRGLALDHYLDEPVVPPSYRETVDLDDPKTRQTFRRAWRDYEEMKRLGVQYVVLPEAGYSRFLTGTVPPVGTAEHYYFTRNRDYLLPFFDPGNGRYELIREFAPSSRHTGTGIRLYAVR